MCFRNQLITITRSQSQSEQSIHRSIHPSNDPSPTWIRIQVVGGPPPRRPRPWPPAPSCSPPGAAGSTWTQTSFRPRSTTNQLIKTINQPIIQNSPLIYLSIEWSIYRLINQSINWSINESLEQSIIQSIDLSISASIIGYIYHFIYYFVQKRLSPGISLSKASIMCTALGVDHNKNPPTE